jgi:Mg2+ and Co2+ transporter CorA
MPKRQREEETFNVSKRIHIEPLLTKRKNHFANDNHVKRQRVEDSDDLRRRNFELEQTVMALVQKIQTLEYMLKMFQQRDTIQQNNLIHAY